MRQPGVQWKENVILSLLILGNSQKLILKHMRHYRHPKFGFQTVDSGKMNDKMMDQCASQSEVACKLKQIVNYESKWISDSTSSRNVQNVQRVAHNLIDWFKLESMFKPSDSLRLHNLAKQIEKKFRKAKKLIKLIFGRAWSLIKRWIRTVSWVESRPWLRLQPKSESKLERHAQKKCFQWRAKKILTKKKKLNQKSACQRAHTNLNRFIISRRQPTTVGWKNLATNWLLVFLRRAAKRVDLFDS